MISTLAKEIYEKTIQLKKYNSKLLLFKKHRSTLENELYDIQELINRIHHELNENATAPLEHIELALFMKAQLTECTVFLTTKGKKHRHKVSQRMWGFHNLPRAFLPSDTPEKITPTEAMDYYKTYIL